MRRRTLVTAALCVVAGCRGAGPTPGPSRPAGSATVRTVIDGDTVVVELGGTEETVRLLGIDTPETRDPRKPVQCYGPEASAHTQALLPNGTVVRLERDAEPRDVYGRLLAYVYRDRDGLFVNAAIVAAGYARTLSIAPNVAHADAFAALEATARRQNLGLWATCR